MQFISGKKYRTVFDKLPPEIQTVIGEEENWEKIHEIGTKYKLHIDTEGELVGMTIDVMMGFIPGNDFVRMITNEINVDKDTAEKIVRDIDEKIFKPIKQKMIDMYGEKGEKTKNAYEVSEFYDPHAEEDHSDLSKHDVLKDIEQPTVTGAAIKNISSLQPVTFAQASMGASVNVLKNMQPTAPQTPIEVKPIPTPVVPAQIGFTKDFITDKTKKPSISGVSINMPTSNVVADAAKKNGIAGAPVKSGDPYREPIN